MDVPGVPGAFIVLDVFTPEECLKIVRAAEGVGFERDEAAGGSALNKISVSGRVVFTTGYAKLISTLLCIFPFDQPLLLSPPLYITHLSKPLLHPLNESHPNHLHTIHITIPSNWNYPSTRS
jgi:hypothetical protein